MKIELKEITVADLFEGYKDNEESGVVAYSGYTSGAKKQAAKSNHQTLIKYFSAELQKCNLGEIKFIENSINCSDRFTNYKISQGAELVLNSKFKNPYKTNQGMPQHGSLGFSCSQNVIGETKVENKEDAFEFGDGGF